MEKKAERYRNDPILERSIQKFEAVLKSEMTPYFDVQEIECLLENFIASGDIKKAMKAIQFGLSQHPDSSALQLKKSQVLGLSGRYLEAIALIDKVLQWEPQNAEAVLTKASFLSQINRHREAITYFKQAIPLVDEDLDNLYLDLAIEYENLEAYDVALKYLNKSLLINPKNQETFSELTFCFEVSGKIEQGIEFFESFINENPYSFNAWYHLGNSYCKIGLFEKSIEAYNFCIAIDESFTSAYFNKAYAYAKLDQYDLAIETYKETLHYDCSTAIVHCHIGTCYEKMDKCEEAISHYKAALEIDINCAEALVGVGIVKDRQGDILTGMAYIQRALRIDSNNPEYWDIYAKVLEKRGRFEDAKIAYKNLIDLEPENIDGWLDYTHLLSDYEGPDKALLLLENAGTTIVQNPELRYRQVAYLIACGKLKEAVELFDHTLKTDYQAHSKLVEYIPEALEINEIVDLIETHKRAQ